MREMANYIKNTSIPNLHPCIPMLSGKLLNILCFFVFRIHLSKVRSELHIKRFSGVVGARMDWEFGISKCKLLYTEWINKVLLSSTGNSIQYPVIKHNEKIWKRMYVHICILCIYIYIYITESFCQIAGINTTL